jgi:N-acetylmuramoyl-L-alanine amidase
VTPGIAKDRNVPSGQRAKVRSVRFWSFGDVTRISIETTGDFDLKYDRLDNPDRLFFDLVGADSEVGPRGSRTYAVQDNIIRRIRVAETQHGVTRVVLDLNHFAHFSTSRLENPSRLMIDVRTTAENLAFKAPEPDVRREGARGFVPPAPFARSPQAPLALDEPPAIRAAPAPDVSGIAANGVLAALETRPRPYSFPAKSTAVRIAPSAAAPIEERGVPAPALRTGEAQSMTRVLGLKVRRVVIDAGHGGHDTGTIGAGGLLEKDLVLDVALRLGKLIQQRMGAEVVYTRSDDTFIPLHDRTRIANDSRADLFLSIHANSSPDRSASGVETYYLNFTSSKAALDVASRENAGSDSTVFELKGLLQKIALQDKIDESREFASAVQNSLYLASKRLDPKSKDRGVRKAPFVVLIGASMPSILAEISFISNPRDAKALKRGEGRQRIAEALYKGVSKYSGTLSHYNVAQRGTE